VSAVPQALADLKVLEFGGYAAGPHIGKVLANYGARTIHVESRERPDGFRIQYPPFKDNRPGYNRSGCFAFFNDSKYSVTVDLKKREGIALAHRMAQWCDLIIENMRTGVMERLGLGFATLAELNPRLIMLSTCNMGQTGPRADQPGFGSQLSALAGLCGLTGMPDGPPMLLYGPYIDYIASLFGASAAMAAVIRSRRSGKGALIDLSQYESGLMFMGAALHDFFAKGHLAERCGNDDPDAVPHGAYQCSDGDWVALSCWSEEEFGALVQLIGHPELGLDPRFATAASRRTNTNALDALISAWTAGRSAEAAAESLQAVGLAAYPVVTMAGLFRDPQLFARGQFRVRRHPEIGDHAYCFPGFDLTEAPGDIIGPAPCVGADNAFVFRDLIGLSEDEYEAYRRSGVFD
jgi:crotonobetainyl-CoA:carnitine CoA-transferase CaiB-like acyl-CoA transferase